MARVSFRFFMAFAKSTKTLTRTLRRAPVRCYAKRRMTRIFLWLSQIFDLFAPFALCLCHKIKNSSTDFAKTILDYCASPMQNKKSRRKIYGIFYFILFCGVTSGDRIPIDHIPEGCNVFRAAVLVLQIIGMFPHINA